MKKSILWLVAGLVVVMLAVALPGLAARAQADAPDSSLPGGTFAVRIYYNEISDLDNLNGYDVWEYNNLKERYVLASMTQDGYYQLAQQGWRMEVDEEGTNMLNPAYVDALLDEYRTVDQIYADMDAIHAANPTITEIVDYGDSYCKSIGGCVTPGGDAQAGYDLRAMRITNQAITGDKPAFFLMANIHAREITTPELAMRMIDWLVNGYNTNADATWIVDYHEVWVVPSVNPDGRWIVDLGTQPPYNNGRWTQRKNANRSDGCNSWPPNGFSQYGIDLNRNHSFMWNSGGSSGQPCNLEFRGSSAASEMEVAQLETLVKSIIPDQRGPGITDPAPLTATGIFITMHSYSELVLWPWGFTTSPAPNKVNLQKIGDKFATYNGYTSCQPSICLYDTSGTSDDFAYGELGVASFTFEVGTSFMPPYSQIDSIQWPDNAPALQYAARIARMPYKLVEGPDSRNLSATPFAPNQVFLRAELNDTQNGGQVIKFGFYSIDKPYWVAGFSPHALYPRDGSYNTSNEVGAAVIDTSGLTPGRHIIYVHAMDVNNNLGPASAIFLDVP